MAGVPLQELTESLSISEEQLDKELSEKHLGEVSRIIDDHNIVGPELGLTSPEMTAINSDATLHDMRKIEMLRRWKQKFAHKATYKKLIEALLRCRRAEDARRLCELLAESVSPEQALVSASYSATSLDASSTDDIKHDMPLPPAGAQPNSAGFHATSGTVALADDTESGDAARNTVDQVPKQVHSKDMKELVVPWYRATEVKPNPEVRQTLDELQDEFDDILVLAQESIESHAVPLKAFRLRIAGISVSQKQNIPMFNQSMLEVIEKSSFYEIFSFMTRMEVWDALNFRVLQKVIKTFIGNDCEVFRRIDEYVPKVEEFKRNTPLRDYIRIRASGASAIPGYRTVMVKVNKYYDTFTLADVAEEEGFLANEFLLNRFIFRLKDAGRGCVQITWQVPASAIPLLMPEELAKKAEALRKRMILEIRADDRYVYMNPHPQQVPRKLFLCLQTRDYCLMYKQSVEEPNKLWATQAEKCLEWDQMFTRVSECVKQEGILKWLIGGKLNVSKNCLDRHAAKNPDRTAIMWEMNSQEHKIISELLEQTCQIANVLKNQCGEQKGDVVVIYMPTMPLAVASMLACARIGAVHSVVFAAFSPDKLQERNACIENAKVLITADEAPIEDCVIPLKWRVDEALKDGTTADECEPKPLGSEEDLFIMYISEVVQTQSGYLHSLPSSQRDKLRRTQGKSIIWKLEMQFWRMRKQSSVVTKRSQ